MGPYIALILLMAAVFGLCFLLDKGFTRLFRGKAQHSTGKAVKLNKKFGSIGLLVALLGLAGVFSGLGKSWLLAAGGGLLILVGTGMVVYYMSFGIYYDAESFLYSAFGKKSVTYRYGDIQSQQNYMTGSGILVELYMADGRAIQLQPGMTGGADFANTAFAGWLTQTGKTKEECEFCDPANFRWFPPVEG